MRIPVLSRRAERWGIPPWILLLLLVAVAGLFAVGVYRAVVHAHSDYDGLHRGVRQFLSSGEPSGDQAVSRYPPTFQVLMAPLSALPLAVSVVLWQALSVLCLLALPGLLERLLGPSPRDQWPAWLLVAPFAVDNLILGQSAIVLLFLVARGALLARDGRAFAGGMLFGLTGMLKLVPAGFLAVPLVLRRARGALLAVAATLACGAALLVAGFGPGGGVEAFRGWRAELRNGQTPWSMVEEKRSLRYNNQSVAITLARTFGDFDKRDVRGTVELARLPLSAVWIAAAAVTGIVAGVWVVCAWRCRQRRNGRSYAGLVALSSAAMLVPLPLVWTHYFLWLLLPAVFLLARPRLVLALAAVALAGLSHKYARGLGVHMAISLVVFGLVARELLAAPGAEGTSLRARDPGASERAGEDRKP